MILHIRILRNRKDIQHILQLNQLFEQTAGIRLNIKKIKLFPITKYAQNYFANDNEIVTSIKVLGIIWYASLNVTQHENAQRLLQPCTILLQNNYKRFQTIMQ